MLELPTVVMNVAIDPSLRPVDVRVYLVASQHLDRAEFRRLKLATLAVPIGIDRSHVHRALRRLCEQGYIERGPRDGRDVTYRLARWLVELGGSGDRCTESTIRR